MKRGTIITIIIAIVAALFLGYYLLTQSMTLGETQDEVNQQVEEQQEQVQEQQPQEEIQEQAPKEAPPVTASGWKDTEITDVLTNTKYTISQIDKPVLLESFAVWCPKCTQQQRTVKSLHEELGDSFLSISLDTDPNEDADQVINHANKNGFDWVYAISPATMTKSLIDEFGVGVVNAPSVPIIVICPGGQTTFLKSGQKSVSELKQEVDKC